MAGWDQAGCERQSHYQLAERERSREYPTRRGQCTWVNWECRSCSHRTWCQIANTWARRNNLERGSYMAKLENKRTGFNLSSFSSTTREELWYISALKQTRSENAPHTFARCWTRRRLHVPKGQNDQEGGEKHKRWVHVDYKHSGSRERPVVGGGERW